MRVVIVGGNGQIARRLGRLLVTRGDSVIGIIRDPAHSSDLQADSIEPVVCDFEKTSPDEVAQVVSGADAVVFAARAGPGSGAARKHTVDHQAAVLLADAALRAGEVTRDDVAQVLVALLDTPATRGLILELAEGPDPVREAVSHAAEARTGQPGQRP
ncbi:NAD(P)H-binding protein [Streptomyces sp. NPDC007355]|uniref:NAD(P)H-binding protein n=1 Tax=Streptomyces sp. NPDC007355 TaxID=3364778 RepID=UPI00367EA796